MLDQSSHAHLWARVGCTCWQPRSEAWSRRVLTLWRSRCIHAAFWKGWWTGLLLAGWIAGWAAVQFYVTAFG